MNPQDEPADLPQVQQQAASGQDDSSSAVSGQQAAEPVGAAVTEISLPTEAEDSDLIEKEWVERAKQIVGHTRDNPYEQQRALSEMKADYMKKRYNKDIKLHES